MIKRYQSVQYQSAVQTVGFTQPTLVDGIRSTVSPAPLTASWALRVVPLTIATSAPRVRPELSPVPLPFRGRLRSAALTFVLPPTTLSQHSLMLALAAGQR